MERIKQALDKARGERQSAPLITPQGADLPEAEAISYTQTRTVNPSPAALRERRVICEGADTAFGDAYKMLRTQVLQRLNDNDWNVLAVTSPGEGEGTTLTAVNLAVSLAMEVNYTVLLVDANLRHPSVHEYFGLTRSKGLSEYLLDKTPLSELLVHPSNIEQFVMLPGGRPVPNSAEMLNSPRMVQLVDELKSRYPRRIVVFDLPPVLSSADALAFAPYVDAALLVIEDGKSRRHDVQRAVDLLETTNVLGTVLNKTDRRSA
jgi:protein-tyrosine kinase